MQSNLFEFRTKLGLIYVNKISSFSKHSSCKSSDIIFSSDGVSVKSNMSHMGFAAILGLAGAEVEASDND